MKNFDSLTQTEFRELSKRWFSIYPLIYYQLIHYKHIDFTFKNEKIKSMFNSLSKQSTLFDLQEIFIKHILSLSLLEEFFKSTDNLIELSKTFFIYNYNTKDILKDMRYCYLTDAYEKSFHPSFKNDEIGVINWRHDGWWNCYFGELKDTQAKNKLLEIYQLSKKNRKDFKYTKFCLTLSYRLSESGNIKLARKILKKEKYFFRFKIMKGIDGSFIFRFIKTFEMYIRWNINIETFLYKSTEKNSEKKKRLKKINKLNSNKKLSIYSILNDIFNKSWDSSKTRPQHLLRIAEVMIDLYLLTRNKLKKQSLIEEINKIYIKFLKTICSHYYGSNVVTVNYFIIFEFYFSLSYFLEKIYDVDIQNY